MRMGILRSKSDCLNMILFKSDCLNMTHWLPVAQGVSILVP
jgi:hypothetical protein